MSIDTDILSTDLENVINDMPVTMTFKNVDISGFKGTVSKDGESGMMGMGQMSDIEFSTLASNFDEEPSPKDRCTIDSRSYKIDRIQKSADGVQIQLFLTLEKAGVNI